MIEISVSGAIISVVVMIDDVYMVLLAGVYIFIIEIVRPEIRLYNREYIITFYYFSLINKED